MKPTQLNGVLGILIAVVLAVGVIQCGRDYQHMGPWGNMPWHMMPYGLGGLFMWIPLLVILAVVVYLFMQSTKAKESDRPTRETPLDILKKRYARGEITREEFEQMKRDIEG